MDGDTLLTDSFFNYILCQPVMLLHDVAIDLYKPTLCKAPPLQRHHVSATPLLPSVGNQSTDDDSGSLSLRDLAVISPFANGLVVTLLL
jgi:hypothetical protein